MKGGRFAQLVTFALIWVALALYSADAVLRWRARQLAAPRDPSRAAPTML